MYVSGGEGLSMSGQNLTQLGESKARLKWEKNKMLKRHFKVKGVD